MVCWGRLLPSRAFSHLLAGIDGWLRLCGVLDVLAPLPHCLAFFSARGLRERTMCWGCLPPSRVLPFIHWNWRQLEAL